MSRKSKGKLSDAYNTMKGADLMAKNQKLEVVSYVRMPDGSRVPFADLKAEEKQHIREKIVENIERTLSRYLTEHPEEIEPFSRCEGVRLIPDPPEKGAALC